MANDRMELDELMGAALEEARRACDAGEVPIGAVVRRRRSHRRPRVQPAHLVGRSHGARRDCGDPGAARRTGNYRLTGAALCVTIEPCLMCVGALVHARIATLVYGAAELKTGAVTSTVRAVSCRGNNHRFEIVAGVREDECRELMHAFFRARRSGT